MMYSSIFQELYYVADQVYGGRLPVHVHCVMDEFANVALPDEFDKLLATMRSREISVSKIWHSSKPFLKSNGKALLATAMSFCIWVATSKAPTNMCQSFWARKPLIPTPTGKALGGVVTIQQIIRFRGVS